MSCGFFSKIRTWSPTRGVFLGVRLFIGGRERLEVKCSRISEFLSSWRKRDCKAWVWVRWFAFSLALLSTWDLIHSMWGWKEFLPSCRVIMRRLFSSRFFPNSTKHLSCVLLGINDTSGIIAVDRMLIISNARRIFHLLAIFPKITPPREYATPQTARKMPIWVGDKPSCCQ